MQQSPEHLCTPNSSASLSVRPRRDRCANREGRNRPVLDRTVQRVDPPRIGIDEVAARDLTTIVVADRGHATGQNPAEVQTIDTLLLERFTGDVAFTIVRPLTPVSTSGSSRSGLTHITNRSYEPSCTVESGTTGSTVCSIHHDRLCPLQELRRLATRYRIIRAEVRVGSGLYPSVLPSSAIDAIESTRVLSLGTSSNGPAANATIRIAAHSAVAPESVA
jgi:hypothetical protein